MDQDVVAADRLRALEDENARLRAALDAVGADTSITDTPITDTGGTDAVATSTSVTHTSGEARDRALFEAIDIGFCVIALRFAPDGRAEDYLFVDVNAAFARHTGLPDAIGRTIRELVPEIDPQWFEIYGHVARTGEAARFEHEDDALGRCYEAHAFRTGHADGNRVAILFNDISDRRRAERALRRSEATWRGIFERLQEGFVLGEVVRDAEGRAADWRYLEVNPAWGRLVGVDPAHALGRTVREIFPEIEPVWIDEVASVVDTGRQAVFVRPVGAIGKWYEGRVHPIGGERFVVIFADITGRRQSEARRAALLELTDRLRDLQDGAEMAYVASEIIGRTLGVSRAGYGTLDLAAETITIARDWNAPGIATIAGVLRFRDYGSYIEALKRGETVVTTDADLDPRTASRAAALRAISARAFVNMPLREGGAPVALLYLNHADAREWPEDELAFVRDVAERTRIAIARRQAEQDVRALTASLEQQVADRTRQLTEAEEALRQSQKMEAVGQLTGGLAHDFNNLLAGITGSLDLLQTRLNQGRTAEAERYVTAAQGAARRAASLTHRLLAFSRRQTLDPKPVDVNRLVADLEELIRRTVGPEIDVETRPSAGVWITRVDAGQLENALLNLCINARDAMPSGGTLAIHTGNVTLDADGGAAHDLAPGDYVQLCVEDDGVGMSADVIARAFDPFFTTKPIGQGTGLGLSMIYGFVRQSGGQVRIASAPGEGATVCVTLPRHHGEAAGRASDGDGTPAPPAGRGETVLVVDDEPTVRMLVTEVLEDLGYQAIEAADGAAGLRALRSDAAIDLLVTDVGLPGGINGRQVADAGRALRPGLRVLFITGYAETAVLGHGHLEPGMHVLTKPFALATLAARIKALIDGG